MQFAFRRRVTSVWGIAVSLFLLSLSVSAVQWVVPSLSAGELLMVVPPDARARFIPACSEGISGILDLPVFSGFLVVFCAVKPLPGDHLVTWVVVQKLFIAIATVLIFDTGRRIVDLTTGIIAGVAFALLFDTFRFAEWILSDTFFVFLLAVTIWTLALYHQRPSRRNRALVYGLFIWLALTRPFGPPIIAGWLVYDLFPGLDDKHRFGLIPDPRLRLGAFVAILILILGSAQIWSTAIRDFYIDGVVFGPPHDAPYPIRYDYTPRPANSPLMFVLLNLDHFLKLTLLRIGAFFIPILDDVMKSEWKMWNSVWLTLLLIGSAISAIRLPRERFALFRMWVTPIVAIALVNGVTLVDASFRYRAPAGVLFSLLFAYALTSRGHIITKNLLHERLQRLNGIPDGSNLRHERNR